LNLPEKAGNSKDLLPITTAGSHPLPPFKVSEKRCGNDENSKNSEENLHNIYRIA
jgi:hypothetical protein